MSDLAIRVEGLGKQYRIGARQERYRTFRDAFTNTLTTPFKRARALLQGQAYGAADLNESIWALKDVSLDIQQGEVIGVIGRNGAGKSTLLKILSNITEPTEGSAHIFGRVGSLLEVGTGFHPELTGRENVYLNGAILGMKREEINRKFDEIVAYAEVEKFIDTPVKHYSSGMGLRLGFAVAAHLETEILVVDEVLAVGDAAFQKKCLGKMGEVAGQGRTILFVSHNMDAIANICSKTCVFEQGKIIFNGSTGEAISHYYDLVLGRKDGAETHVVYESSPGESEEGTRITRIELLDANKQPTTMIYTWDDVIFRLFYHSNEDIQYGSIVFEIRDYKDQRLIVLDSGVNVPIQKGAHFVECFIPHLPLVSGDFVIGAGISVSNSRWIWRNPHIGSLQVLGKDVFGLGRPPTASRMMFAVEHQWKNQSIEYEINTNL